MAQIQKTITRFVWPATVVLALLASPAAYAETYFYHNDHLGTPQALSDSSQQIAWEVNQKPFGESDVTTNVVVQNIRFPGQYADIETGLSYNYFRTYDSSVGRYTQSDPIGLHGGLNRYGYALQNPNSYYDPDGRLVWFGIPAIYWAGGGTAVGVGYGVCRAGGGCKTPSEIEHGPGYSPVFNKSSGDSSEGDEKPAVSECPPLPEDFQGTNPQLGKGRTMTDAPEGETAEEMFDRLTGGTGGKQMEGKPPGQIRGENGVIYRPPTDGKPARVEIPENGPKPHESVHWD